MLISRTAQPAIDTAVSATAPAAPASVPALNQLINAESPTRTPQQALVKAVSQNTMTQPNNSQHSLSHTAANTLSPPPSPKIRKATQALTVGASKAEVIEALIAPEPTNNPLINAIRQFLPSWFPNQSPNEHGAPVSRTSRKDEKAAAQAKEILNAFKSNRFTEAPKVVPGMMDALRYFKDNKAHVVFCTNANALKVSQEWTSVVQANWQTLTGLQVSDEKKLTHIFHSDAPTEPDTSPSAEPSTHLNPANWNKMWTALSEVSPKKHRLPSPSAGSSEHARPISEPQKSGFRIDIMGKCGKGKLPLGYPAMSPNVHLNPHNLAKLGITRDNTLHFVGNEIKDAAAARYLADQGFNVQFYFLNSGELADAIEYLEHYVAKQPEDHPDHEEQVSLLKHCKRWDLANWSAVQRVTNGHELLDKIAPALQRTEHPKVLMDFHGTITDQIQTLSELVNATTPTRKPPPLSDKLP